MGHPTGVSGRAAAWALALACGALTAAAPAAAQDRLGYGVRPEARVDALLARRQAVHAALGANVAPATYLRVSLVAGAGVAFDGDSARTSGRLDLTGRFVLDPFRQFRIGGYAGLGLGMRGERGDCCRPLLLLVAGAEGRRVRGRTTAVELGYGGGVRLGVILRGTPRLAR